MSRRILRRVPEVTEVLSELADTIQRQQTGRTALALPWPDLDHQTSMLRPGTVSIVGGPTKTGKSFLLMQIALHLHQQGVNWSYLPLEDSRKEFGLRAVACSENTYTMIAIDQGSATYRSNTLKAHEEWLAEVLRHVTENPRTGCKDSQGKTVIPRIPWQAVLQWTEEHAKDSKLVIIDPLSQIDFDTRNQNAEEADFIRRLLAIAQDTQACIVLAAHAVKRRGHDATLPLTEGDLQGSAMLSRLVHTLIMLEAHEERAADIYGYEQAELHNRTIYISAARNGAGTRQRVAFRQMPDGPEFQEIGVMLPKMKAKKDKKDDER